MEKERNMEKGSLVLNLLFLVFIPFVLLLKRFYIVVSIYNLLISIWIIMVNKRVITKNYKSFFIERKKLKNLKYYYITDDKKVIDLENRRNTFSLFRNMTMGTMYILIFDFISIFYIFQHAFGKSEILNLVMTVVFSLIVFIGYGGMVAGIVFKYTTTIYVLIPLISAAIYWLLLDPLVPFFPGFAKLAGYLFTTTILYWILACIFPPYVLRKLSSKTVLISSFTTILAVFSNQIFQFYFLNIIQSKNYALTAISIKNSTDVTDTLKNILVENPDLIEAINDFLVKEMSSIISSKISLLVSALTMAYIVGAFIINSRISKNKLKAKYIYRVLIKEEKSTNYDTLIKCAFYGGEEYENLLINNNTTLKVIRENEVKLDIPDISRKTRFIAWFKRNSILFSTYNDIKQLNKY